MCKLGCKRRKLLQLRYSQSYDSVLIDPANFSGGKNVKTIVFLALTAAITASSAASAADVVDQAPTAPVAEVAAPAFSWSGPYFGVHGGYGWADAEVGGVIDLSGFDGGRFGGFVGYNWDLSNGLVVGVEGDVNYDWNDRSVGDADEIGTDWSGSVRGRVGYALDRTLIYAAGGWTAANAYVNDPVFGDDETTHGWTIGAGVDWAVVDNMFVRAEYRYNDFGGVSLSDVDVDFDQHVINVGVGVKF